jgi:hypothetical protein
LTGGLRVPLLIGIGSETLQLLDWELVRGSSSQVDNVKTDEDVSSQLDGLIREFTVSLFPVVTGEGQGVATFNPNDVKVTINGQPAGVASVDGPTGLVTLTSIPKEDDEVKVTYHFKRTDTRIGGSTEFPDADDLSVQADGTNKDFKVSFPPIVDGTNGGIATTDVSKVSVTIIRGASEFEAEISEVDGQSGVITLAEAPEATDQVLASYFTNRWQDTFDYLPVSNITEVVRCGTAPGRSDFTNTLDFVIEDNKIQWGNSFSVKLDVLSSTVGSVAFEDQINAFLFDNKVYMRPASGDSDGSNTMFSLEYQPTEGTGKGRVTDDPSKMTAWVGTSVTDALTGSPVEIEKVNGSDRKIYLKDAPASGKSVFVTYYHNRIADDTFTFESTLPSTPSTTGEFEITSLNNDDFVHAIVEDKPSHSVTDPDFATEGITFPAAGFDGLTVPGFSKEETVLLSFISATEYLVISSIGAEGTNGSGSLGQTYVDEKTGTRFTIMPGTTVSYTPGDILEFDISKTHKTGALPFYSVPGLKITITETNGVTAGNTANLTTYNKSGLEPDVGDFYFLTVDYAKTEFPITTYTRIRDVVDAIGDVNIDNRLSLAAQLAFSNGAIALALAQVTRDSSGVDASPQAYLDVLSQVESPLQDSGLKPDIITVTTTDQSVINEVRLHVEKMSTIRNKTERTGVFGFAVGTTPEQAQQFARNMKSERMVGLYPDGAVIGLIDELGNVNEAVVDGSFLASAFTGLAVNPTFDVATPLTHKTITGFRRLVSQLDSVTMNQTAVAGLTILEDLVPNLLIRHALTTNMSTVLTREPTVIYIKDFVQQQIRAALSPFIGIKFLPTVLQDVETSVDNLLNQLVNLQIITDFQGTSAVQDENDPTIMRVETFYSPVFPVNWIVVQLNLRVRL